jgi:SAM-dependent methyltransferase
MSQPQAFDALAPTYDADFTQTIIGRYLRNRVHERLTLHFPADSHVLELGCGTGEDALRLAERGVRVMATDASAGMLDAARAKTADSDRIVVRQLDLANLDETIGGGFDGAFSNFGPLNCLHSYLPLARWLAPRVRPGGIVAFGMMSPLCLWEPLWHGLHGDVKTATRRWRKVTTFQAAGSAEAITIRYPSIRRLAREFYPRFIRRTVRPLGLFLPPSDVYGVIEKRPALLRTLLRLEDRFGQSGALAAFADHYWIEFERVD